DKNPKVGMAHIYRWRYTDEFLKFPAANDLQKALQSAAANDIEEALKLAPEDPEVLLTAALASEQKADSVAARAYLEKGFKLAPKNFALALGLARLETRERHLDRPEAALRQAFQPKLIVGMFFIFAETLTLQDKIEGNDGAAPSL